MDGQQVFVTGADGEQMVLSGPEAAALLAQAGISLGGGGRAKKEKAGGLAGALDLFKKKEEESTTNEKEDPIKKAEREFFEVIRKEQAERIAKKGANVYWSKKQGNYNMYSLAKGSRTKIVRLKS